MALFTEQQIVDILNGAPATTPDVIFRQMGGASYYGDVANATYNEMWYAYENAPAMYREVYLNPYLDAWQAGGGSVTPSAVEMLNTEPVVNSQTGLLEGTKSARMPATTTGAGNVKQGALAGRCTVGTAVAGIAIGAGVGLKEVATHPQFWNDLSDAVVNDLKSGGNIQSRTNGQNMSETLQVVWRAMQDGSIQAYCDKRDVDTIIENLYKMDAFNVIDIIDTDIDTGLTQVNMGALNSGYLSSVASAIGMGVPSISALYDMISTRYPNANVIVCRATYDSDSLIGSVGLYAINLPDGMYDVQDSNIGRVITLPYTGWTPYGTLIAGTYAGEITGTTWIDGSVSGMTVVSGMGNINSQGPNTNTCVASNAGATFKPKNDNVIYNGTDVLPPSDIANFWNTYAAWLANGFTNRSYDPLTNSYVDTTYIPFTAPDINWQTDPITGDQTRVWTGIYDFVDPFIAPTTSPINNPSPWVFESIGNFSIPDVKIPTNTPWDNNPKFPNPTPTPIGSSPTIAAPSSGVSSGSKLYTVYNPSQANIDALGAYLWTQNVIDLIEKFFSNNPLDAIISLHMIYCAPTTGSNKNIYLGYLDSGVSSPVVTSQYETIACGDINIPELYGNALDYDGTSIQVFLPFIGWRPLKTREVMGKRLRCTYKIDVYTGTCLALLSVISANTDQLLYSFEGNCSVQIPLTASDRTRMLSGLITAGVSAFTGNPAGVVGGIASIKSDVDRSGSFTGNAGAMGVKKPYVVITRPLDAQASGYNSQYGYPLNKSGVLKNFKGFTRVQSVHVDIPGATDYEKKLIEEKLKNGIII